MTHIHAPTKLNPIQSVKPYYGLQIKKIINNIFPCQGQVQLAIAAAIELG